MSVPQGYEFTTGDLASATIMFTIKGPFTQYFVGSGVDTKSAFRQLCTHYCDNNIINIIYYIILLTTDDLKSSL